MSEEKRKGGFGKIVVVIAATIIVLITVNKFIETRAKNSGRSSVVTQVVKKSPTVKVEQGLSYINFYVQANDNYDEVHVTFCLLDKADNIFYTETLRGYNYVKGNTYTLTKNITLSQLLNFESIKYKVSYYV